MSSGLSTQNSLLLKKLLEFYNKDGNMEKILPIINGESTVSLRLVDWFAFGAIKPITDLCNPIAFDGDSDVTIKGVTIQRQSTNEFFVSYEGESVKDNKYLSFTLTSKQVDKLIEESITTSSGLWSR